jgi:hypothetical protein
MIVVKCLLALLLLLLLLLCVQVRVLHLLRQLLHHQFRQWCLLLCGL